MLYILASESNLAGSISLNVSENSIHSPSAVFGVFTVVIMSGDDSVSSFSCEFLQE